MIRRGAVDMVCIQYHEVTDDGQLVYMDENDDIRKSGKAVQEYVSSCYDEILQELKEFMADDASDQLSDNVFLHEEPSLSDDDVRYRFEYRYNAYPYAAPQRPILKPPNLLFKLIPSVRRKIESRNEKALTKYERQEKSFPRRLERHEEKEKVRRYQLEHERFENPEYASDLLVANLMYGEDLECKVSDDMTKGIISFTLISVDEIPQMKFELNAARLKLTRRKLTQKERSSLRLRSTYSLAYRLIDDSLKILPTIKSVIISAYENRNAQRTCVFSVVVIRDQWSDQNDGDFDLVSYFASFTTRVTVTASYLLKRVNGLCFEDID